MGLLRPVDDDTDFPIVLWGYDREKVNRYITDLEQRLRAAQDGLDVAATLEAQLTDAHAQLERGRLAARYLNGTAGIGTRLDEILATAEEEAATIVAAAQQDAARIRAATAAAGAAHARAAAAQAGDRTASGAAGQAGDGTAGGAAGQAGDGAASGAAGQAGDGTASGAAGQAGDGTASGSGAAHRSHAEPGHDQADDGDDRADNGPQRLAVHPAGATQEIESLQRPDHAEEHRKQANHEKQPRAHIRTLARGTRPAQEAGTVKP
jgi:hypothetical protein